MDPKKRQQYLKAMGIDTWQLRKQALSKCNATDKGDAFLEQTVKPSASRELTISSMDWETLENEVAQCQACSLYKSRTRAVFGTGPRNANLLIVGEAPGANEDKQGEPFVGRGGQLLNAMLQAIALNRQSVYITNILKSRPPNNRDPDATEVAACTPFLLRQIMLIQPKAILAVGRIASQYLLNTTLTMAQLRGRRFEYGPLKTPLLVTYHPAYLLRSPRQKQKAWEDMQLLKQLLTSLEGGASK